MSRASRITFTVSCLITAATVVGVHYVQEMERETLHQGPIKDAKRVEEKRLRNLDGATPSDPTKERKRYFNMSEHEEQKELRKKYEMMQPLSGEVVTKGGEVVKGSKK
ncbi:Pet117p SKDI_05G1350 [Saccharomyces kudriavzevii IFO 1802]|uniref:PET117-like protein n=2 Tax=Saccharomyces kudriavzevii (strain ATCC MYA-4449 / AS 2.2408 / CBS 8840 / NBRC 1802 / NCYC 2889) TaxID=226230 RepID=J6EL86_SACK1|nr:uncharacterized protein SKDI_05G1350 [Saccharomyces kudriavzevii IFO 1802]EJT43907.1 PET117-like protein [Saccharomyces kudriavzevii IFO 1802]CAI4060240.1 hypothetical protein SKDI_05G1350 [Saccharomyces kudriavzevii IFO 1802]